MASVTGLMASSLRLRASSAASVVLSRGLCSTRGWTALETTTGALAGGAAPGAPTAAPLVFST